MPTGKISLLRFLLANLNQKSQETINPASQNKIITSVRAFTQLYHLSESPRVSAGCVCIGEKNFIAIDLEVCMIKPIET